MIVTEEDATIYKFALWIGNSDVINVKEEYGCVDISDWFFDNPPRQCAAGPPVHSRATVQSFEHGLMIWVEEVDSILILLDDHVCRRFATPLELESGASMDNRVGGVPPGYFEPEGDFGLIWRGEVTRPPYRQTLGWAIEPAIEFETTYQPGITTPSHFVDGYIRLPDGKIIHFYRQMYLTRSWDEWPPSYDNTEE
jgi:hypothetical protein